MDKIMQVINILEQHADATVAGSTMAMAISAMLTLTATVAIVVAVWSTARGTKQLAKIAEREEEARKTPDVVVWLKPEFGRTNPLLNIVVGNVGTGVARDVRWWFQNVDREDWEGREITMIWPDRPETAPSIDVLMPGEKFEMTLGGPSLVVPDRKPDCCINSYALVRETPLYKGYSAHCTVRFMFTPSEDELHRHGTRSTLPLQHELAFSIAFYATGRETLPARENGGADEAVRRRGPFQEHGRRGYGGVRTYTCDVPKLRNTGGRATHPLHRIADALEKATGGPKYFGESPEIGQPASEVDKLQHGKDATQA